MSLGTTDWPAARASTSFPSATDDVAKSTTISGPPARGTAHASGLVPITRPEPPNGATTGPELHHASPTFPAAAIAATYSPKRPTWLHRAMVTAATPLAEAISLAKRVASWAAG